MTPRVLVGLVALSFSFASAQTTERPLMVRPPQMQTAETQRPQVQPQTAPSRSATTPVAVPVQPAAGRVVPSGSPVVPSAAPAMKLPASSGAARGGLRPVRLQVVNTGLVRQALGQQSGGLVIRPRATAPFNPLQLPTSLATSW